MKKILSIIISGALVVSGYSQTRNVLVGTNNSVVQPTNFWSADASNARTGLGLGTAATNSSSAFQAASLVLSNLAVSNGSVLKNLTASNITGTVGLASNITGVAALATNVTGVVAVVNGGTGATNASEARSNLGLGTAATSATSAFQPSSSALTNLAANNGGELTNLQATNLVGMIPASNISTITISNVGGILPITQGGTGATNASGARIALELGTAATNPSTAFQAASSALTNLAANNGASLTNLTAANIIGTVGLASNITGTAPLATNVSGVVALANGGTAGTNAVSARTSLGATTVGGNLFTLANPDDVRFLRLNANNTVSALTAADMRTALSVGTNLGTVTSVGLTVPNIFSLSGSTITSSGTFALTLANQSSRQAFLVPNGGGIPAFRGIESDDLPSLAIAKITGLQTALDGKLATNGTAPLAVNVTGTVAVANGGTGGTTAESGRTGLGATTVGSGLFTLANPSSIRFIRLNADNTVSSLSDSDFRTAIGLGTAATNAASVFQPSSGNLTNLAANNGGSLTNIPLSAVTGALATNGNGFGLTNINASNITGTLSVAQGGTGATNAAQARTNLGLGWSALTNTDNLAFRNAINIGESNAVYFSEVGVGRGTDGYTMSGTAAQTSQNFGFSFKQSGLPFFTISNLTGTNGGALIFHGTVGAATTRTNLGLGLSALTNNNAINFRSDIGLGWSALTNTNAATSLLGFTTNGRVVANTGTNVLTFTNSIVQFTNVSSDYLEAPWFFVGSGGNAIQFETVEVAATTRTNLRLGWSALTNTNVTNFRTAIGLGATNNVIFNQVEMGDTIVDNTGIKWGGGYKIELEQDHIIGNWTVFGALSFNNITNAATTRTNLGLGWPALTNTNAATSLLGFTTNGQVVANVGTNVLTFTNSIKVGDTLHNAYGVFYDNENGAGIDLEQGQIKNSLGNIVLTWSDTNSISVQLPLLFNNTTNAATTRTNLGLGATWLTNTNVTNFRSDIGLGWSALTNTNAGTGFVSVNTNGDVVSPTNFWQRAPIQTLVQNFTPVANATNAATNARTLYVYSLAISTTGITNVVTLPTNTATFNGDEVTITHMGPTSSVTAIRQLGSTNNLITINKTDESVKFIYENNAWTNFHNISFVESIQFSGTNASNSVAASRTNLGLGATWLTNTNVTNFRTAIELGATNNVTFSNVTSSGTLTSTGVVTALSNVAVAGTLTATSTITAKTNLVVEGYLDFTTNATNSNPAVNNQINDFIEIRIGTNQFWLPVYK